MTIIVAAGKLGRFSLPALENTCEAELFSEAWMKHKEAAKSFKDILVEKKGHIVCLTLNRPDRANAISREGSMELLEVFQEYRDDPDQRAMIITGAGDRSFCSGMYVTEAAQKTQEKGKTEGYTIFKPWTDMMQSTGSLSSARSMAIALAVVGIWLPIATS